MKLRLLLVLVVLGVVGALAWGAVRLIRTSTATAALELPTTKVKQGRVTLTVAARGELQGGNSEMLTAPMIGGTDMAITSLRDPGELVSPGDVVVQFDTTEQEFKLKEAEADLAEAEQQVVKAEADSLATDEESQYAMLSAQADVKLAELEIRRNPTIAVIAARQNEILLEAARNRLRQATQDLANKKTTSSAGIAIQKAQENKAKVMADIARKNIENMTLKAKTGGYVNVQQNTNLNMMYWGMTLPPFQLGDTTRAGRRPNPRPQELGSQRQRRRARPRSPQRRSTRHHRRRRPRRQDLRRQSEEHRWHHRSAVGPPLRSPDCPRSGCSRTPSRHDL
jgi:multidrug efflux pump subunit AcrA (membrane-fusion protein)